MSDEQNRPMTQHDLIRHLADTLVENEVIKPMESIGWQHGQPPAPGALDNPTPSGGAPPTEKPPGTPGQAGTTPAPGTPQGTTPQAKADTPPSDLFSEFETLRDPITGLILNKYKTPAEAVKGVGHAVTMAKQAFEREAAAIQENARLKKDLEAARLTPPSATPAGGPSHTPSLLPSRDAVTKAQAAYDAVLSKVVEEGGILDEESAKKLSAAQRELVRAEASAAAEEVQLQRDGAKSAEDAKWDRVNKYMEDKYPDSTKFAEEIGLYLQTDPLTASAVQALVAQGKEQEGAELAWKSFDSARQSGAAQASLAAAQTTEVKMDAADQVRKEAVEQARKDAGIPGTSASGVHERGPSAPSQDEIEAAAQAMRAYGTQPGNPAAARWRELTIGRNLPPEIFGS